MAFSAEQERLHRSWRRWGWMTNISLAWLVIAMALLPFGPDIVIFVLSIAPTDKRTALTVAWIAMIAIAMGATTIFAIGRHSASKRAAAAGVMMKRKRS